MKTLWFKARRRPTTTKENVKGVSFHVAISPYYFPEAIQCQYDEHTGLYKIKFVYINDECEQEKEAVDDGVIIIHEGQKSGKLTSVSVKVDRHNLDSIDMAITQLVEAIEHSVPRLEELRPNFEAVAQAIRDNKKEIEALVPA